MQTDTQLLQYAQEYEDHNFILDELAVLDELTYRSYAWNRLQSPHISPVQWGQLFPDWKQFEEKFQQEDHDCKSGCPCGHGNDDEVDNE